MPPTHTDEGLVAAQAIRREHPDVGRARALPVRRAELRDAAARGASRAASATCSRSACSTRAILVDALRRITIGETVVDPTIVARLVGRRRRDDPLAELTPREREVLTLVAEGLSNGAIADELSITERTVEAHVKQIFLKLGLPEDREHHRRVLAVLAFLRS